MKTIRCAHAVWYLLAALLAVLLFNTDALAADDKIKMDYLDRILGAFNTQAGKWETILKEAATWLFYTLGTISLVITFGLMAVRKAEKGELFAELVRFILFFGLFKWLLDNGSKFSRTIIESLSQLAVNATDTPGMTQEFGKSLGASPSAIIDRGFNLFQKVLGSIDLWPTDIALKLFTLFVAVGVLIMFCLIAVNMLLLMATAWVQIYAGVFLLGFGGSRWTQDIAINYYKSVLATGLEIMTIILLMGIAYGFITEFANTINASGKDLSVSSISIPLPVIPSIPIVTNKESPDIAAISSVLIATIILYLLSSKIPPMVANMVGGGVSAGTGSTSVGFGTLGSAIGMAGSAVGIGMSAVAGQKVLQAALGNFGKGISDMMEKFSQSSAAAASMPDFSGGDSIGGDAAQDQEPGTTTPLAQAQGQDSGSPSYTARMEEPRP